MSKLYRTVYIDARKKRGILIKKPPFFQEAFFTFGLLGGFASLRVVRVGKPKVRVVNHVPRAPTLIRSRRH